MRVAVSLICRTGMHKACVCTVTCGVGAVGVSGLLAAQQQRSTCMQGLPFASAHQVACAGHLARRSVQSAHAAVQPHQDSAPPQRRTMPVPWSFARVTARKRLSLCGASWSMSQPSMWRLLLRHSTITLRPAVLSGRQVSMRGWRSGLAVVCMMQPEVLSCTPWCVCTPCPDPAVLSGTAAHPARCCLRVRTAPWCWPSPPAAGSSARAWPGTARTSLPLAGGRRACLQCDIAHSDVCCPLCA
jgi:hypothetical protein